LSRSSLPTISVLMFALLSLSPILFRRRCGVSRQRDLLAGVPVARLPMVLLCCYCESSVSLFVMRQYTLVIMYSDRDIGLSELL
jgi:hypothetical protein